MSSPFLSRRNLLKSFAGVAASTAYPFSLAKARSNPDHFFILFMVEGGFDPLYFGDPRPQEMTEKNMIANYTPFDKEPPIDFLTGQVAQAMAPLKEHQDAISLIRGVIMNLGFDGHEQNLQVLFTGNPFVGSANFLSPLNLVSQNNPIDVLDFARVEQLKDNRSRILTASPSHLEGLRGMALASEGDPLMIEYRKKMLMRIKAAAEGRGGLFQKGSKELYQSLMANQSLKDSIQSLKMSTTGDDFKSQTMAALASFKSQLASTAVVRLSPNSAFDTHDSEGAKDSPDLAKRTMSALAECIQLLKQTFYDEDRSFLDVTTFAFTSEFGRTMRQTGKDIMRSGTDHNAFNNCVLVGGKNIKPGQIIGESDLKTAKEFNDMAERSPHHRFFDPKDLKTFGKPYDFSRSQVIQTPLENEMSLENYISMHSVTNTIFEAFGVPRSSHWHLPGRQTAVAPLIKALLKG